MESQQKPVRSMLLRGAEAESEFFARSRLAAAGNLARFSPDCPNLQLTESGVDSNLSPCQPLAKMFQQSLN